MQNKGAIQVFAILLALACIWHLSFTVVTNRVESKIRAEAGDSTQLEQRLLDSMKTKKVWLGYTYDDCKKREINLGLDLKGGMNVTLEVSIPDLLRAMANKTTPDSAFNKAIIKATELQRNSQKNYIDLFVEQYKILRPQGRLASPQMFGHSEQTLIKPSMTNEEVIPLLKKEAEQAVLRTYKVMEARIDQFGVTQPNIQLLEGTDRILVELPGVKDPARVQELLQATAKLEFYETYENSEIYPFFDKINTHLAKIKVMGSDTTATDSIPEDTSGNQVVVVDTTKKNDSDKVDTGTTKPNLMGEGMSDIERERLAPLWAKMQCPIYQGEDQQQRLMPGPVVGYCKAADTAKIMGYFKRTDVSKMLPKDLKLRWTKKSMDEGGSDFGLIALKTLRDKPVLEGDVVTDAQDEPDQTKGGFMVRMTMNGDGATQWFEITKKNKGKSIAIVLDEKVYSYPTVEDPIAGGVSTISGRFTADDAQILASVLKAGKLPTPAKIVEQAVVGPSLGKKAIRAGVLSLIVAFMVILLYIAFFYGKAGITADIALFTNMFFLIGTLAAIGTTLTLPGIAGLVLTIGMSVDSNVLIFERIKEELRHGKRLKIAIEDGYRKAYSAIIDANITLAIITLILMFFGAGPVKGFAVVLFIGILTSTFSSIFITRLLFEWQLKKNWNVTFSTKLTRTLCGTLKLIS